jgi:hypothetical protein
MTPGRQMLELVGNLTLQRNVSPDEFLDGALAILTAAIGKLPPEQREDVLAGLEDGQIRRRVACFVEQCAAPQLAKRRLQ